MSKHTLFLVHGMGIHKDAAWSDETWKKIVECSERYPHFKSVKKLEDYAEPYPVGYDDLMRGTLARWNRQATEFGDFMRGNELQAADSLDWLAGFTGTEAGFLSSHVADVIIYRFFKQASAQIRSQVQLKIFERVKAGKEVDVDASFSLMSHSLGTSVTHDALAEMAFAPTIGAHPNTFDVKNFQFKSLHLLANVSRLLQTTVKAYKSPVRPGSNGSTKRYCDKMYCHRHELDPIIKPKPFAPVAWGANFTMTNLRHYRAWNVHGWLHYLDHPEVHIPLIRSISKTSAIPPSQVRKAVDEYSRFGDGLENLAAAKDKLATLHSQIQSIEEDSDFGSNIKNLVGTLAGLEQLRAHAGDTWAKMGGGAV